MKTEEVKFQQLLQFLIAVWENMKNQRVLSEFISIVNTRPVIMGSWYKCAIKSFTIGL